MQRVTDEVVAVRRAWHALPPAEALEALGSGPAGLSAAEAAARLERHGPNELPYHPGEGALRLLLRQIAQPLIYVLLGAALVSALMGHFVSTGAILAVVVFSATIGFVNERRATRQIQSLARLATDRCTVVRDGREREVATRELVPGDLIVVAAGDKLPADARIVLARGLMVDEAPLTGESVPVAKDPEAELPEDAPLPDRRTMLFAGTLAPAGLARAVVVATGADTELARIAELVAHAERLETPLTRRIAAFSWRLAVAILALGGVTFGIAQAQGQPALDGLLAALALVVASIPEGLPAIMTIALAVGVGRMAARNALVRQLPAVETLGSTTVICSDKTGTLTRGEMAVAEVFTGATTRVSGQGYAPEGGFRDEAGEDLAGPPEPVRRLLEAALLCSDARLVRREGRWAVEGDPTEGALVAAAAKAGIVREEAEARHARVDALPFDPEHRLMATLHEGPGGDGRVIVKGAPEAVVPRCQEAVWGEGWDPDAALAHADAMAARGLRVLAVAEGAAAPAQDGVGHDDVRGGLRLLGLVGSIDPPREEAIRAVDDCRRAGIRVAMITGDHPNTAAAVARELGIDAAEVRTGRQLEGSSDEEIEAIASSVSVFARVAPEHKLRLVAALQRRGEVVAMTGDGVNDAPALRQADIGVAMGLAGTDVSKEAADIVLRDDNFATIAGAVDEGRRVYGNLLKAIVFALSTNAGQALLIVGAVALGLTLPLLPAQVLWVNLVTTVALALPLAVEAREPGAMERPPRRPDEPVLGRFAIERIALVGVLMFTAGVAIFEIEAWRGVELPEARASVATAIMLIQAAFLFNCRSLHGPPLSVGLWTNPWVYVGIAAALALQIAFVYAPVMNDLFETAPIGPLEWVMGAGAAAVVLPLVELHRWLSARAGRA